MKPAKLAVEFCPVHSSIVIAPEDDPDDFWLCEASNLSGDRTPCERVEAEISWLSPS